MGKRYKKNSSKKRLIYKIFGNTLIFMAIQIFVFCSFSFTMVYYGPLVNIREMLVTSAMTTLSHQYIATLFLSDKEINRIMDKNKIDDADKKSDIAAIEVHKEETVEDKKQTPKNDVRFIDISTDTYKGYMLMASNPDMVSVASTDKIGKLGMQLTEIVKTRNALGGINAGGFADDNGQGNGGTPQGIVIENGRVVYGKEGIKYPIIGFNDQSVMVLGSYTLKEAKEHKIRDAVTFGPYLIVNGESMIKSGNGGWGLAPRTAIGQKKDGTILMLVIDGRQVTSIGATLKDVQDIMLDYGAYNAANLDGGASTTMVYDNKFINSPSSKYGPRYLPTAFIVKKSDDISNVFK